MRGRVAMTMAALLVTGACGQSPEERQTAQLRQAASELQQSAEGLVKGLGDLAAGLGAASGAVQELSAAAQDAVANDPDLAEYKAYRLSMPVLTRVEAATRAFSRTIKTDPAYRAFIAASREFDALESRFDRTPAEDARMEALRAQIEANPFGGSGGGDGQSLDAVAAEIAKMAPMADALRAQDVAPREYAKFTGVLMQAYLVASSSDALAGVPGDQAAQFGSALVTGLLGVNLAPENVAFVRANRAAVERLMETMQELGEP